MGGRYLKARQLAKEMEKKAKDTAKKKKEANKKLDRADELLEISKNLGLDFEDAEGLVEDGKEELDKKNFDEALSTLDKAIENLRQINLNHIDDRLSNIEDFLKTVGEDRKYKSLRDEMEEARELITQDEFSKAHDKTKEINKKAEQIMEEGLEDDFSKIDSLLEIVEGRGENKEEAEQIYSDAKNALEDGKYERAMDRINECKTILGEKIKDDLNDMIQELEKEKDQLMDEGVDVEDITKSLEQAKELEEEGEFQDALDIVQDTSDNIADKVKGLVNKKLNVFKDQN
ncbi:MAG: hypothetical protein ACOCSL_03680, partial [Thermoplasmatota archaeon]